MDRISIGFVVLTMAIVSLDMMFNQGAVSLFLVRKVMDLMKLVAFWR
jgi:hypothetical protein